MASLGPRAPVEAVPDHQLLVVDGSDPDTEQVEKINIVSVSSGSRFAEAIDAALGTTTWRGSTADLIASLVARIEALEAGGAGELPVLPAGSAYLVAETEAGIGIYLTGTTAAGAGIYLSGRVS